MSYSIPLLIDWCNLYDIAFTTRYYRIPWKNLRPRSFIFYARITYFIHFRTAQVTLNFVTKTNHCINTDFNYTFRVQPDENDGVLKISEIRIFVDTMAMSTFFIEEVDRIAELQAKK
jgi:Fe-S cluster assembly iron-binding protein IscA